MALWQFDVEFMPDEIVPDAARYVQAGIGDDGLETAHWWNHNQPTHSFRAQIEERFPRRASWYEDVLRWGDEEDVLIESWIDDGGAVESISARVDLRHATRESFDRLVDLADALDCHVYVLESQQVVPPAVGLLLPHVAESRAAEFCRDPHGFLKRFAQEFDADERCSAQDDEKL